MIGLIHISTKRLFDNDRSSWLTPKTPLPDDALVVRGGQNLPIHFAKGSGVAVGEGEKLQNVSVNCAPGLSIEELTAPSPQTGYPGIPHN